MAKRPKKFLASTGSEAWGERQRALERFAVWEAAHPRTPTKQAALDAVGFLYELLPAEARRRPVDTRGVQAMHRALAVLTIGV